MNRADTFAIVTGGGTAGHVLPALAVAEALVANGHAPSAIHYVGARRGIETRLLPDTPFPHTFLDVVGLQRQLTRRNLGFVPKLMRSARAATELLRELEPRVVVSVGGYASLPATLAARRLRIPIVVVSYDRFPGRASRFAARRAAACPVACPDSPLPRATVTGAPLRQAVLDVERRRDSTTARAALGLPPDRFVLAVMGGSQGSGVLNDAVVAMLDSCAADRGLAIRHAVGERFVSHAPPPRDGRGGVLYQPVAYEPDMPLVYAAADLFVGRGGASTVHEVAATGVPAILVPWTGATADHQTANVAWLADAGGAILLPERRIEELAGIVDRLRSDAVARDALGDRARAMGEVHRSGALADLVEAVALA